MIFYLDLLKPDGSIYTLSIESLDTFLGKGWSKLLKTSIDDGAVITEPNRIYALNDNWTPDSIKEQLLDCIDVVNIYKPDTIIYKDNLNYLHKCFEDFMRPDKPDNKFYEGAPGFVRHAIRELNIHIHRLEHMARSGNEKIVVSLNNRPRVDMTLNQALEFKCAVAPGDVMIKYCHKGKKITDIFSDDELGDRHVGNNNIIPQHKISADFKIYLSNPIEKDKWSQFDEWLGNNINFFDSIGIDLNDPMNTIGFGKVGHIIGNIDDIKKEIYGVTKIYNVRYN